MSCVSIVRKGVATGLVLSFVTAASAGMQPDASRRTGGRAISQHDDAAYSQFAGEKVRRLTDDELRQLIPGATISHRRRPERAEGQIDVSVPSYDTFNPDGSYIRGVERTRTHGAYTISSGTVCSITTALTRCRNFFHSQSGYYFSYLDSSDTIISINIRR